jgi:flagellar FliL protein
MNKKIIIIIVLALAVVAAGLYFFVFSAATPKEPDICYYSPGDYFVTNVKDSTALLKVTIVIEYSTTSEESTLEFLTEINHAIRDIIVFTLRSKTEQELRSQGIEQELRNAIANNLNKGLGIDYITTIYFNDFVIQ